MRITVLLALIGLAGCNAKPNMDADSIYERAELVQTCPNGIRIGRDPISQRLTWRAGFLSGGLVANGVSLSQVCAR